MSGLGHNRPLQATRWIGHLVFFHQAQRTRIAQATLSAIENDRVRLGVERAKVLVKALKCHPVLSGLSGMGIRS